jgi:3-hydroxyacyl-[acyl-carrier-protein] dehydratase
MSLMDIREIEELLPHRYPFLLVDRILEMGDDYIVGIKNVTMNEPHFTGHFPKYPVMPGVLIVEAMAQVAGVFVLKRMENRDDKLVFLATIDSAKFRRPVIPGDQLRLSVKFLKMKPSVVKIHCEATVDGAIAAEAEMVCRLLDNASPAASQE